MEIVEVVIGRYYSMLVGHVAFHEAGRSVEKKATVYFVLEYFCTRNFSFYFFQVGFFRGTGRWSLLNAVALMNASRFIH